MSFKRLFSLCLLAALIICQLPASPVMAADYPSREIRLIVASNPGGGDDACQGRSVIPQNRRNRIPRFRRFEKSPASVVLLHRCRQREIAEHASLQLLP